MSDALEMAVMGKKRLPLERLQRVELSHWDAEGSADFRWVHLFVRLPNIREISGNMIGSWAYFDDSSFSNKLGVWEEGYERCSPVEKLTFSNSAVEPRDWQPLFAQIAALRSLEYQCGGAIIGYADWDAQAIIEALRSSAEKSLMSLRLWDGEDPEKHGVSDL